MPRSLMTLLTRRAGEWLQQHLDAIDVTLRLEPPEQRLAAADACARQVDCARCSLPLDEHCSSPGAGGAVEVVDCDVARRGPISVDLVPDRDRVAPCIDGETGPVGGVTANGLVDR